MNRVIPTQLKPNPGSICNTSFTRQDIVSIVESRYISIYFTLKLMSIVEFTSRLISSFDKHVITSVDWDQFHVCFLIVLRLLEMVCPAFESEFHIV